MHLSTRLGIFSLLWGASFGSNWRIYIHTADQDNAGTNDDVRIKLFGENEEVSSVINLGDNFNRGTYDIYDIGQDITHGFTEETKVTRIELSKLWSYRTFNIENKWKVDRVVVENRIGNMNFTFPVISWIQPGRTYLFNLYDTSLPQNDQLIHQRTTQLEDTRLVYEFDKNLEDIDKVGCKSIPVDEEYSRAQKIQMAFQILSSEAKVKAAFFLKSKTWESIESIKDIFSQSEITPEGLDNWDDDVHFGLQRLTGNNIDVIELYQNISPNFPVTNELLGPVLEGMTIQEAIIQKRLFICDYSILQGVTAREDFVQCAPFGLFFVDKNGHLKPIAIQLFQEPGLDNPIFTPTDPPNTWTFAKMWLNNADTGYHQTVSHIGGTHFTMEGILVASHRNLARSHPIFKLLAPHFLQLVAINKVAVATFVEMDNSVLERTMTLGQTGFFEVASRHVTSWRMDVHGNLPEVLKLRGVEDPDVLPGFSFRDDGLLVYEAIQNYAKEYVDIYYTDTDILKGDNELKSWIEDIVRPTDAAIPGCGIKGVPGNGELTTIDQLVQILTSIIWINSGKHAAVMFKQWDQMAFPPNSPMMLYGSPPQSKQAKVTDEDILNALPNREDTMMIGFFLEILDHPRTNALGNFEVDYVFDPPAVKVVEKFRARLREVSATIKERNISRDPPYSIMDPDNIPNSISG